MEERQRWRVVAGCNPVAYGLGSSNLSSFTNMQKWRNGRRGGIAPLYKSSSARSHRSNIAGFVVVRFHLSAPKVEYSIVAECWIRSVHHLKSGTTRTCCTDCSKAAQKPPDSELALSCCTCRSRTAYLWRSSTPLQLNLQHLICKGLI